MIARQVALASLALLAVVGHADARITPEDYRAVGVTVPPNAVLPLSPTVIDEQGRARPLGPFITRPTILVFADYECRTLCGPALAFVADALERSGLPADQFRLVVIGLGGDADG